MREAPRGRLRGPTQRRSLPGHAPRSDRATGMLVALVAAGCGRKDGGDNGTAPATTPTTGAKGTQTTAAQDLGFPTFATKNTTRIGGADAIANAAAAARAVYTAASRVTRPRAVALA